MTVEEASGHLRAEVWPENEETVNVFIAMGTQWLVGMGGATGLNYAALPAVLQMMGVHRCRWPQVFDGLRTMEEAALEQLHKK